MLNFNGSTNVLAFALHPDGDTHREDFDRFFVPAQLG
jgi:hypothetical protein